MSATTPMVAVEGLTKVFRGSAGIRRARWTNAAVRDVTFAIDPGESLALVGESGSGKTTLARLLVGLEIPTSGRMILGGRDLSPRPDARAGRFRASTMQVVFQDPYTSLTPHQSVAGAVDEVQRVFFSRGRAERLARTTELLEAVGLGEREGTALPRRLSGGQRQRVAIARALAAEPKVLILDEPVSALDVSIQAQILNLLADLRRDLGLTYLFITHDLAVVRQVADRVVVLYRGRVVEVGAVEAILGHPLLPYTRRLLDSVPRLHAIPERRPAVAGELPTGCVFRARCPLVRPVCDEEPDLVDVAPGHACRCWLVPGAGATRSPEPAKLIVEAADVAGIAQPAGPPAEPPHRPGPT